MKEIKRSSSPTTNTTAPMPPPSPIDTTAPNESTTMRRTIGFQIFVPKECSTLNKAVKKVQKDPTLTTIVLGKGKHKLKKEKGKKILTITSSMNIIGDPRFSTKDIVVVGGIVIHENVQGNVHFENMTIRQAKKHGVEGLSSFTMEDVIVEQCRGNGVVANGTIGRCTNVEVCQCGRGGVAAIQGGSITLIGSKTSVHHNKGGLVVVGSSSEILVVWPKKWFR